MGFLTTHVLDTANGCPAEGINIQLFRLPSRELLAEVVTNLEGRVDQPILNEEVFKVGQYELIFKTKDYFEHKGNELAAPAFLDEIVIRFGISDPDDHYHVPLLVSPWSFSTYRGS